MATNGISYRGRLILEALAAMSTPRLSDFALRQKIPGPRASVGSTMKALVRHGLVEETETPTDTIIELTPFGAAALEEIYQRHPGWRPK